VETGVAVVVAAVETGATAVATAVVTGATAEVTGVTACTRPVVRLVDPPSGVVSETADAPARGAPNRRMRMTPRAPRTSSEAIRTRDRRGNWACSSIGASQTKCGRGIDKSATTIVVLCTRRTRSYE
jgi:hypothetical protein